MRWYDVTGDRKSCGLFQQDAQVRKKKWSKMIKEATGNISLPGN